MRPVQMMVSLFLSWPAIRRFLTDKNIGADYGIGFRAKLGLLYRFRANTHKVETLSDFREHMEIAAAILRVPRATPGSVVECGCYVGGSTVNLSLVCAMTGRKLIVFDSFAGLPEPKQYDRWHRSPHVGHTDIYYKGRFAAGREIVEANVSKFGDINVCEFRAGYYENTMSSVQEPIVAAFLDVDLIDSLKPCLIGLWPNLQPDCRIYTHEAGSLSLIALYFDQQWWQEALHDDAPGFVGSGVGLPLGISTLTGSELGYTQKPGPEPEIAPDQDPDVLRRALKDSEKEDFAQLSQPRLLAST